MKEKVEKHIRPNSSCLEICHQDIAIRRRQAWPYEKIKEWLRIHKSITVSAEAIRKFCLVRNIRKGPPINRTQRDIQRHNTRNINVNSSMPASTETSKKLFIYDDSNPIVIKH